MDIIMSVPGSDTSTVSYHGKVRLDSCIFSSSELRFSPNI